MMGFDRQRQPRVERFAVAALVVAMMVNQSAIVIVSPLVVDIAETFGVSVALAGQLRTVAALTSALIAPWIGVLSVRAGPRPLLLVGLAAITLAAAGSAAAPSFGLLLGVQLLTGLGIACLLSMALAAVGDYVAPERREWAVGMVSIGQPLAWVVGLPVIGLLADGFGWRWSFVGVPLLFSLVGFAFVTRLPAAPGAGQRAIPARSSGALRAILRGRSATAWIVAELCSYSGWSGTLVFLGAFYIQVYGVSAGLASLLLALPALGFVVGSLMAHRVAGALGPRWAILATATTSALLVASAWTTTPALPLAVGLLTLFGLLQGIRGATSTALGLRQLPEYRGAIMAMRASVVQLGYVVGGLLGGVLLATLGFGALGVAFAALITLSAVLIRLTVQDPAERAAGV